MLDKLLKLFFSIGFIEVGLIYILSPSNNERTYKLGSVGYIIKPKGIAENSLMIESALKFSQFLTRVK